MVKRIRKIKKRVVPNSGTGFWSAFSSAYTFGATLLVSMVLMGSLGFLIDKWLNTLPALTIGFAVLGIYLAFRVLIKDITKSKGLSK